MRQGLAYRLQRLGVDPNYIAMNMFVGRLVVSFAICLAIGVAADSAESPPAWQAEWERTVKAAEAEGQLTVYISGYSPIIEAGVFQKAFPKIKVTIVPGTGSQLAPRIVAERRGEKFLADVYNGGGTSLYQVLYSGKMLEPIRPALMLPEVTDTSKWWEGRHKYVDREGSYMFVYEGNVSSGGSPAYNTQLISPKDYRSYWDFLNPKLKGKIGSIDIRKVRGVGPSMQYLYYHPEIGVEFLRRFYQGMDVHMSGDFRQAMDWLATGKVAALLPMQGSGTAKAKAQGLPVDEFGTNQFKEGVNISSAFGQVALMNRAPHPNAAKVFVNWLLSREGQTTLQKTMSTPGDPKNSRRVDVPKDHIPTAERRRDGMKYFDIDDPETKDINPAIKLIDEIFAGTK
jgi:iron(III) transport system substrate-binding protein